MTTWNYNRIDTKPGSYTNYDKVSMSRILTLIMIRSAGAEFSPEYSDSSLTVKTQCV